MTDFMRKTLRLSLSIAFLSVGIALPIHAEKTPAEVDDAPPAAEKSPAVQAVDAVLVEIARDRREIQAIDTDAERATGDDLAALSRTATDLRLQLLDRLQEAVDALQKLESQNAAGAAPYRERVVALLPEVSKAMERVHRDVRASIAELRNELESAGADAAPEIEASIRLQEATLNQLLSAGVEQIERLETFGLDAAAAREWLRETVSERGRLMASRIHFATRRLEDAERMATLRAGDAAVAAERDAAAQQLQLASDALAEIVPIMVALELDASRYKSIVLASTGEITTEVLDTSVIGQLAGRWISGVRESIAINGPSAVFKAMLFMLVLAIFWGLSRFVRSVTERAVGAPHLRFSTLLQRMIVSVASGLVMIIGVLVGLSQLGFQVGPMVAGLGIAGFIVGFALQETLGNFAAGIMILAYRPYDVGDLIECAGASVFGKVSHMSLVSTTIMTVDNRTRVVPNGKIWGDVITNVTAQTKRRVDLVFGISYTDDIPRAEQVLMSILKEHPKVESDPEPVVKLHELGDSSVNFVVRPWVHPDHYWDVWWDVTREVKMRFDREGISIPFPQRDVHFYNAGGGGDAPAVVTPTPQRGQTALSGQDAPDAEDDDA